MASRKKITIGLAGNPNSGKTTIFNRLTGARQHVANYPGITVEQRVGRRREGEYDLEFVDLPGTYSLTAFSQEELVARNFCIEQQPDVVVDVIDASNLERNLYLGVQLMELGVPLVLALNMSDVARRHGIDIDAEALSRLLGVPIVPTVGTSGEGLDELLQAVIATVEHGTCYGPERIRYGREIEDEIAALEPLVGQVALPGNPVPPRWVTIKLLENDPVVTDKVARAADNPEAISKALKHSQDHLETILGESPEVLVADFRYGFISGACTEAVRLTAQTRHDISDRVDAVLLHSLVGPAIFAAMMFAMFYVVFTFGAPLADYVDGGKELLKELVAGFWAVDSESPLKSLLVNGVIEGVGSVLVFLPNIMLLFLVLAFFEDSGYLARAAFLMDRVMHKVGLHGKSFVPMLLGFGCSVPAIMATRTLETRRDRLITMLVLPLVSCNARLPIYLMIVPAFFPQQWQAPMVWLIYLIGIGLAMALAWLLRNSLFRGETMPLVIELPPYRMPTWRGVLIHMWQRAKHYVKKAGTLILMVSIVMWALSSYPKPSEEMLAEAGTAAEQEMFAARYSVAGRLAEAITPAMEPLGFDWRITNALIPSFTAKEMFVSQMSILYSLGEEDTSETEEAESQRRQLIANLARDYTPLTGFCIAIFCLVSAPCMATIVMTWRESGHWKWALLQLSGLTTISYLLTLIIYQVGSLLGIGTG